MLRRKSLCGNQIQIVISDATREDQSDRVYDVGTEIYKEVSKKNSNNAYSYHHLLFL